MFDEIHGITSTGQATVQATTTDQVEVQTTTTDQMEVHATFPDSGFTYDEDGDETESDISIDLPEI